jgi:hypothetical protein
MAEVNANVSLTHFGRLHQPLLHKFHSFQSYLLHLGKLSLAPPHEPEIGLRLKIQPKAMANITNKKTKKVTINRFKVAPPSKDVTILG